MNERDTFPRINGQHRSTRIIALSSGKGGVGKTTLSVLLALEASRRGLKSLLIDADINLPSLSLYLNTRARHPIHTVMQHNGNWDNVIMNHSEHLDVISGCSGFMDETSLNVHRQREIMHALQDRCQTYDLVLIDTAPGIGQNVIYFASSAQIPIVVTTPSPASIQSAFSLIKKMSTQQEVYRFQIVVNQANHQQAHQAFEALLALCDQLPRVYIEKSGSINTLILSDDNNQTLAETMESIRSNEVDALLDNILARPLLNDRSAYMQFLDQAPENQTCKQF